MREFAPTIISIRREDSGLDSYNIRSKDVSRSYQVENVPWRCFGKALNSENSANAGKD